jgi:hypothetical protein
MLPSVHVLTEFHKTSGDDIYLIIVKGPNLGPLIIAHRKGGTCTKSQYHIWQGLNAQHEDGWEAEPSITKVNAAKASSTSRVNEADDPDATEDEPNLVGQAQQAPKKKPVLSKPPFSDERLYRTGAVGSYLVESFQTIPSPVRQSLDTWFSVHRFNTPPPCAIRQTNKARVFENKQNELATYMHISGDKLATTVYRLDDQCKWERNAIIVCQSANLGPFVIAYHSAGTPTRYQVWEGISARRKDGFEETPSIVKCFFSETELETITKELRPTPSTRATCVDDNSTNTTATKSEDDSAIFQPNVRPSTSACSTQEASVKSTWVSINLYCDWVWLRSMKMKRLARFETLTNVLCEQEQIPCSEAKFLWGWERLDLCTTRDSCGMGEEEDVLLCHELGVPKTYPWYDRLRSGHHSATEPQQDSEKETDLHDNKYGHVITTDDDSKGAISDHQMDSPRVRSPSTSKQTAAILRLAAAPSEVRQTLSQWFIQHGSVQAPPCAIRRSHLNDVVGVKNGKLKNYLYKSGAELTIKIYAIERICRFRYHQAIIVAQSPSHGPFIIAYKSSGSPIRYHIWEGINAVGADGFEATPSILRYSTPIPNIERISAEIEGLDSHDTAPS